MSDDPDTLSAALARHEIELTDEQIAQLDQYCTTLWRWNENLNLTRHTDYERFVSRDVVDSMALEQFLDSGERVLDVGTGGGVPGVILAILRPDLEVTLSESIAKKAAAVGDIARSIDGVEIGIHHGRAESLLEDGHFESLVVRAVAPLEKLLRWFKPYTESFNQLLVIKGPAWVEERKEAREKGLFRGFQLRKLYSYPLPGTNSESVVLQIRAVQR